MSKNITTAYPSIDILFLKCSTVPKPIVISLYIAVLFSLHCTSTVLGTVYI